MSSFSVESVSINAIISCLPSHKQDNLQNQLIENAESFVAHTGIQFTYKAQETEQINEYFLQAISEGLAQLQWQAGEISMIVCVSQTPNKALPSCANQIHAALSGSDNCICFDINQGCSGFVYGLSVVSQFLEKLPSSKAILCVGDFSSRLINPQDPSTQPVFSDAVSVTFLSHDPKARGMEFCLGSIANGVHAIEMQTNDKQESKMVLNGIDVFSYSLKYVPNQINELIKAHPSYNSLDTYVVLHQANMLINKAILKNIHHELTPLTSIEAYGNTSSASIPLTICKNLTEQLTQATKLCISGFGVGFSIATALIELPKNLICKIIEYQENGTSI